MPHIFISYAREDMAMAKGLAEVLESEGFEVWWDDHIRIGEEFPEKIERAIWDCHHVIVLWSKDAVESKWVRREAQLAKSLNKLLPVKLGDCELPHGYKTLQTIDFGDWGTLMRALYNVIGGGGFSMPSYARHNPPSASIPMPSAPVPTPARPEPPRSRRWVWVTLAIIYLGLMAYWFWLLFF